MALFLMGIGYGVKGAVEHVRADFRGARQAKVKTATKKAGGKLPKGEAAAIASRHATGWWLREASCGFPAARTGWHAGWIAHKTALERQRIIREEARTEHLQTLAQFRKDRAGHAKLQAEARAELERQLAADQASGSQVTGRKAVQKAAAKVASLDAKRASRQRQQAAPPLPADSVRPARRVTGTDMPARPHFGRDSDWLEPGQPRCEGCDGSGSWRTRQGVFTCPACRGFGSRPPGADEPVAPVGTICAACGQPSTGDDPVTGRPDCHIHARHADEDRERYERELNRMRAIDGAPVAAGGSGPSPDAAHWSPPQEAEQEQGDGLSRTFRDLSERHAQAGARANGTHPAASPTTSGGTTVPDTTFGSVIAAAKSQAAHADDAAASLASQLTAAEQIAEDMQSAGMDGGTLSAQLDHVDRLRAAKNAAEAAGESAGAVESTTSRNHGGVADAVQSAPVTPARDTAWYQD